MNYRCVKTIPEALRYLDEAEDSGRVIAGGTDVVVGLKSNKLTADTLIDISGIPEANSIKEEDGHLVIGCAVTLTSIARSALIHNFAPILAKAAGMVGSVQVRNAATLVGNVVTANPEADAAMALMALGASFRVEDRDGIRTVPMEEMYNPAGGSAIDPGREIVTAVYIPCQGEDEASAFMRIALRKAMAPAVLNAGIMIKARNGKVVWARISMGPVAPVIKRAAEAEAWLPEMELSPENIKQAAKLALEDADPLDNPFRGSHDHLMQVLSVLLERGLTDVANQLKQRNKTA